MKLPLNGRVAVFIDGANLYATCKALQFEMDYSKLKKLFADQATSTLVRIFYYSAVHNDESDHQSIRPLIDWLDYNGFAVVTKPAKEFTDALGRRKIKGNMDIELAIDALEIAERVDEIVIFSGDGDFRPLIEAIQRKGVRVNVVSTLETQPQMVADELRRQADLFIDLTDLASSVSREGNREDRGEAAVRRTVAPPRRPAA